jgi:hypothetical protein
MSLYALGLDWISKAEGWAYCRIAHDGAHPTADFGTVPASATADQPLVRDAAETVVDAPIGLPDDADEGCKARPCDLGFKKWIGTFRRFARSKWQR